LRLRLRIAAAGLAAATMTGTAGLTAVVSASPAQAAGPTYTTISKLPAADPGLATFGSSYYVYATGGSDGILPIFRGSSVTKAFSKVGNAYAKAPEGLNNLWAPHVVARDGKYFMFFTAAKRTVCTGRYRPARPAVSVRRTCWSAATRPRPRPSTPPCT
jgi:hypothetical protein